MMNKNRNKRRNGFTIAEIVIALTMISVVALTAATVLSGAYMRLLREKSVTTAILSAQKDSELIINTQRATDTGFVVYSDCFLPNHKVTLKQFKIDKDEQVFYSLVSKVRPIGEVVPRVTKVNNRFYTDVTPTSVVDTDYYYPVPKLNIRGVVQLDAALQNDFMVNTVYWYVSKPGYYVPSSVETVEYGQGRMPYFPSDYELVAQTGDKPATDFDLSKYAGRHVVMEVVPATLRGLIGVKAHTPSLYIHALQYTKNIYAHYDSSCLELTGSYYSSADKVIQKWKDISGNKNDGVVVKSKSTSRIMLDQTPENAGTFTGHDILFQGDAKVKIPISSAKAPMTIFVVRRIDPKDASEPDTTLYVDGVGQKPIRKKSPIANNYAMYVYRIDTPTKDVYVTPSNKEDGIINEVIVFSSDLYAADGAYKDAKAVEVENYISAKYGEKDPSLITAITAVNDIALTVRGGTEFNEPNEAQGVLSDGRTVPVKVEWNKVQLKEAKDAIKAGNSTTSPIVKVVQGNVLNEPSKKLKMTITIPIDDVLEVELEKRVIAVNNETKLKIQAKTFEIGQTAIVSLNRDDIIHMSSYEVAPNSPASLTIRGIRAGKVDLTVTFGSMTKKFRVIVTDEEPPVGDLALWLDSMDKGTVQLDIKGNVAEWRNKAKAINDPLTNFKSIYADAPTYVSTYDSAYVEFTRGKNLKAEKLDLGIEFKSPFNNSNMTVYYVGKLHDNGSPHALLSQSHSNSSIAHVNYPAYLLSARMQSTSATVSQAVYKVEEDYEIEDDDVDDDDDLEDADDKVELKKRFVLFATVSHSKNGSKDEFEFGFEARQGLDKAKYESEDEDILSSHMLSANQNGVYIGKAAGGMTLDGSVFEILIYKGIHDEVTKEKVLKYLKQKWYD